MSPLDIIVKALEPYDIPTGSWSAAEKVEPARAVLDALTSAGLCVVPLKELEDHADGNVGDGCWDLHDKYAVPLPLDGGET